MPVNVYTAPSQARTAYASLRDIVLGAAVEDHLGAPERNAIDLWCQAYPHLVTRAPFRDLLLRAGDFLADPTCHESHRGLQRELEAVDGDLSYYRADEGGIRELYAVCRGIVSDGRLPDAEVYALRNWLLMHAHLRSTYPYDELVATLTDVLADDHIEPAERAALLAQLQALAE